MNNCHCHSETPCDGSSRLDRYLQALDPNYAPVDGRSFEDLLVFAKRLANQIRFYDIPGSNIDTGDKDEKPDDCNDKHGKHPSQHSEQQAAPPSWREFFRRDMAVIAASIAVVDLAQLQRDYTQNRAQLEAHPNVKTLNDLFDPILGIAAQIDHWYSLAIPENPLYSDLTLAINSTLREQIQKVAAYEEGYKFIEPKNPLCLDYSAFENDTLWGLDAAVEADASVYEGATLAEQIRTAALSVDDIFHVFYGFMADLVDNRSVEYLRFALQAYPGHQPHMALFIAFLELFRLAQQQMNGLTARMLDFYYRNVLHLTAKPPIPDRVHVVFELAKDVTQYSLARGTALKAGKDASGKDQTYITESDIVLNRAKVKELKTIFIQREAETGEIAAIYARPQAKSSDGFGDKITDPSGKWPTFGKGQPSLTPPQNICQMLDLYQEIASRKDQAQVGFALASPQLLLQGGNRLIQWIIPDLKKLSVTDIEIWLTGNKGWLRVGNVAKQDTADASNKAIQEFENLLKSVRADGIFKPTINLSSCYYLDSDQGALNIYLPIDEVGIVPFDAQLHPGYSYPTKQPIIQVMLGPNLNIAEDAFKTLSISGQILSVQVGSIKSSAATGQTTDTELYFDGLKILLLQNETGLLDANRPFDPFTLYPNFGKSFYIGSAEVFNKPLHKLAIDIGNTIDQASLNQTDNKATDYEYYFRYAASILFKKRWDRLYNKAGDSTLDRWQLAGNLLQDQKGNEIEYPRFPIEAVTALTAQTAKGFIKIDLVYPSSEDYVTVKSAVSNNFENRQALAPFLQINELSVNYISELKQENFRSEIDQFFHVYPFGVAEIYLEPPSSSATATAKDNTLAVSSSRTQTAGTTSIHLASSYSPSNFLQYNPINSISHIQKVFHDIPDTIIKLTPQQIEQNFQPRKQFNSLDAEKGYLLVDANGTLLPQFNFKDPNADYDNQISQSSENKDVNKDPHNALMNRLVYEAKNFSGALGVGDNQYSNGAQQEGMLFIGIEQLRPLETLSLLFHFAEGSAADEDSEPPIIHWSYLTNNEWRPLPDKNLLSDGTYGFKTTGIIKIDVPEDSTDQNTLMPAGLRWFCAGIDKDSGRIPMLVDVVTQAVVARFQDSANDPRHYATPLPPGSIGKLATPVAAVGKVEQPFASFDGKAYEVGKEFYTRVSERLRHKGRPITAWDYEHLVLERFPSIYKVKCITHSDPSCLCRGNSKDKAICCGPQIAPGHVLLIPIADFKNRNAVNPLQPKTNRRTLLEIEDYLRKRSSPFVQIHAKNPVYEQVLVFFRVQFIAGTDKGYFLKRLNDEIVQYLTPWAFDSNAEVSFAQKIYASAIINFIEERPYVDFITDFLMFVCRDQCCPSATTQHTSAAEQESEAGAFDNITGCCDVETLTAKNGEFTGESVVQPSTPRSLLVSAPQHIIIPYDPPPVMSPCEQRKAMQTEAVLMARDQAARESADVAKSAETAKAEHVAADTKSTASRKVPKA